MSQLNQLLNQLPQGGEVHMSTMGQILWITWQGGLPQAVSQTLLNYGGMLVGDGNQQQIWFFFTNDVFLALARLKIWGNFNELPVAIEMFSGRLQLSNKREASLAVEGILGAQELYPRESLDIFIHPASKEASPFMAGITFERASIRQGMAAADWQTLVVDSRMPYSSTQSWFLVLHPLGDPLDKNYQAGWRAMFQRLEKLFNEQKIKFIVQDRFVTVSMDNLLMLRTFLREYLLTFDKDKQDSGNYWPTVCVVSDRKNLNFNADLPNRIGLKWDSLMPDFPYLSYRNAFLLGSGFVVKDIRFTSQTNMDSWCNTMLDENSITARSIPLVMSAQLSGNQDSEECFYCGLSGHTSAECPTRTYLPTPQEASQEIASMDLEGINDAFRKIEHVLSSKGLNGYAEILEKEGNPRTLMRAIFDINGPCQLRNVPRNWLYRMRDPDLDEETPSKDDSPAWEFLERLTKTGPEGLADLDKDIAQAIQRVQRDPRLRMVRAFVQIERNDPNAALNSLREAAAITPQPALQAWAEFLQGRLLESQGQYAQASTLYQQVLRVVPQWREVTYRGLVCRVKMGFAEQVLDQSAALIRAEPEFFNRFLIDPALERGRLLILSTLHDMWEDVREPQAKEQHAVAEVDERLHAWFPEDHPVFARIGQKIKHIGVMGSIDNYMAFFVMSRQRPKLEMDLNDSIQREVEELRNRYKGYLDVLEEIRDEASWFPFPSALKDFTEDFNKSAGIINWAFGSNFNEAETFKKAQKYMPELDMHLQNLKKKLNFLRTVRDCTLFALTMSRTFIWIEIVGLLLCFLGIPAIVFWGEKWGLAWLKYLIGENQWAIQKVLIVIVTILAIGISALRTTVVFEKKREKLLDEAREQREKAQEMRLEAVKRKRKLEEKRLAQERKEARDRETRKQLKARFEN